MIDDGSYDNPGGSGIKSMTVSPNSFSCIDAGPKAVTLTVTDNDNNVAACTTTVTIVCHRVTCHVSVTPCPPADPSEVLGGPSSQAGSGYGPSHPFIMYLGYGPQCVTLSGRGYGSNVYYANCWSADAGNPAPGGLSCYTCANPVFTPTVPGIYTFHYTTYGSPNANNGCTPTPCSAVCDVTICVKDINDAVSNSGPGNGNGNGNGNNGKGKDGYGHHDEGNNADKKVYICHVPAGNPSNTHVIYVSKNAAAAHIGYHGGDYYYAGPCESPCVPAQRKNTARQAGPASTMYAEGALELTLYPNPTRHDFRLNIAGAGKTADIKVYDLQGRVVENLPASPTGVEISVGTHLAPGTYIINVRLEGNSKNLQVVKM
jgi:hypothetical protein